MIRETKEFVCITARNHPGDIAKYICTDHFEAVDKFREEYCLPDNIYIEVIEPKDIWIFEQ